MELSGNFNRDRLEIAILGYTPEKFQEELAHVHWKNGTVSTDGSSTRKGISPLCSEVQWQSQCKIFFMLGPIFVYGLCSTFL
jgi:hypothetical protein